MRAMVYTAPLELKMLDVEEPAPMSGELLVEVGAAGICGSELEGFATRSPRRVPPLIMGHEFAGRVIAAGDGVDPQTVGRRVAVNPLVTCGKCELCRMGRTNACPNRRLVGMHRPGAFAHRLTVPADQAIPLSDGFSDLRASLIEPLSNGVHAVRLAADTTARAVCVFGAGAIGLLAAQAAKLLGGTRVMMVDVNDGRLERALGPSADAVVNSRERGVPEAANAFTEGRGFDYTIDAAGVPETRRASAEILRPGGSAVWIGIHSDETPISGMGVVLGEKRLQGSYGYTTQDFVKAYQLLESGAIEVESWTKVVPLEEGIDAFNELLTGQARHAKTILCPSRE